MYVKNIIFYNRAPFDNIHLTFEEKSISVLTAVNGKGKTTILSYIMDAWIEMTRMAFDQSFKDKEDEYYRISSGIHLIDPDAPSFVYIRFVHNGTPYDYLDYRNGLPEDLYNKYVSLNNKLVYSDIKPIKDKKTSAKYVDKCLKEEITTSIFSEEVMIYMPSFRSEIPNYLNDAYKTKWEHDMSMKYSRRLINPLEVSEGLPQLANWLLDLLLDCSLYSLDSGHAVPEDVVWENINSILRKTLISKHPDGNLRLGAGRRGKGAERLSIVKISDRTQIYPSIFGLSTGEQSFVDDVWGNHPPS